MINIIMSAASSQIYSIAAGPFINNNNNDNTNNDNISVFMFKGLHIK